MAKTTTTLMQKKYINDITVDDLRKNHKIEYIHKFQQALINNPGKSKQVVCDIAGVSNNTLTRYMEDLGIKSFYRHDHKINRKKQDKEDKEKIKTKSSSSRKDLKGGGEAQQSSLSATYDYDETFNKTVESLKK
jgi:DNA-binding MurR/RpiR family transcriptional regulator